MDIDEDLDIKDIKEEYIKELPRLRPIRDKLTSLPAPPCVEVVDANRENQRQHQIRRGKKRKCQLCGLHLADVRALKKHLRLHHQHEQKFWCTQCTYKGISKDSLTKHRMRNHPHTRSDSQDYISCMESVTVDDVETQCGASFNRYEKLRGHLAAEHGIDAALQTETVRCASVDDFLSWKMVYEANASVAYRINSQALTKLKVGKMAIYKCSRSGVYNPEGKGLRRLKSQGSSKLGRCCTSEIRVQVEEDGSVVGTVFTFHYGHGTGAQNVPHLRIPAAAKAVVKEKLLKGVDASRIIQDMRSSLEACGDPSSSRTHRITRKDLTNMAVSLGVSTSGSTAKIKNEVINVEMYAEETLPSDQMVRTGQRQPWEEDRANNKKIKRRHDTAAKHLSETAAAVTRVLGAAGLSAWRVTCDPATSSPESHTVDQLHRSCPLPGATSCRQRCQECDVCVHMLQCTCHDWVEHNVICKHIHMVCLQDVELVMARLHAGAGAVREAAEPQLRLAPAVSGPVQNDATPEYLAQKAKEFVEVFPSLPPYILEQVAERFRQVDRLLAISAPRGRLQGIHQQPVSSVSGDQRVWNGRLERQPTLRISRPARPSAAATVTSADVPGGRHTVMVLRVEDVELERTPSAPDHMY